MHDSLHRLAALGNLAAVVSLVMLACVGRIGAGDRGHAEWSRDGGSASSPMILLVVLDGLRADVALDPAHMPGLAALRQRGVGQTLQVESLVPSTVAGIVTMMTGTVPPPTRFVYDFAAPPASSGGVLAALDAAGESVFVAGPRLWHDLYGRWIDDGYADSDFHGNDPAILAAAQAAVASGRHRLIVVHLVAPDVAAHESGSHSRAYADAVRWCDEAITQLIAGQPDLAVVVTSDHGVTDDGTHGGLEPSVATIPLVAAGPGLDDAAVRLRHQRDVAALLAGLLDVRLDVRDAPASSPTAVAGMLAIPLGLGMGLLLAAAITRGAPRRLYPLLCATPWCLIVLLLLDGWTATIMAGTTVLAVCLAAQSASWRARWSVAPVAVAGLVLGAVRWADGLVSISADAVPASIWIWPVAVGVGVHLAHDRADERAAAMRLGAAVAIATTLLGRVLGQTASLSSVQVSHAFGWAGTSAGLALAVLGVVAMQALPAGLVLMALAWRVRRMPADSFRAFCAGLAICLIGQAWTGGVVLAWTDPSPPAAAVAMGLVLRVLAETTFLFGGLALLALASRRAAFRSAS